MLSKPCGELYCHALTYCDMCGRHPFSTAYNSEVSGPQGANSAPSLQWQAETSLSVDTEVVVSGEIGLPPQPVM